MLRLGVTGTALAVAALAIASLRGSALAASTAGQPRGQGARITRSHTVFTWQLPFNEEASAIQIATKPDMSTDGYFFSENRVEFDTLQDTQTSWSSDTPMTAGHYWWSVRTWYDNGGYGPNDYGSRWSSPVDFYVPLQLSLRCASKFQARVLSIACAWDGNAKTLTVGTSISKGTKRLASGTRVDSYHVQGKPASYGWTWRAPSL